MDVCGAARAATQAGVEQGDQILEVDGSALGSASPFQVGPCVVWWALCGPCVLCACFAAPHAATIRPAHHHVCCSW